MKQERDYGLDLLRILCMLMVVRPVLWSWLHPSSYYASPWMVFYVLGCVAGIFLVCCAVEWCRKALCAKTGITDGIAKVCDKTQNKFM